MSNSFASLINLIFSSNEMNWIEFQIVGDKNKSLQVMKLKSNTSWHRAVGEEKGQGAREGVVEVVGFLLCIQCALSLASPWLGLHTRRVAARYANVAQLRPVSNPLKFRRVTVTQTSIRRLPPPLRLPVAINFYALSIAAHFDRLHKKNFTISTNFWVKTINAPKVPELSSPPSPRTCLVSEGLRAGSVFRIDCP